MSVPGSEADPASHDPRQRPTAALITQAALLYFLLVFAAGFVLGIIRELLLVPRFGVRYAELLEQPVMLAAIILAARCVIQRLAVARMGFSRLWMGLIALLLMLGAEAGLVSIVRGMPLDEYIAGRDPVSGAVYLVMLGVFAGMPSWVRRSQKAGG